MRPLRPGMSLEPPLPGSWKKDGMLGGDGEHPEIAFRRELKSLCVAPLERLTPVAAAAAPLSTARRNVAESVARHRRRP